MVLDTGKEASKQIVWQGVTAIGDSAKQAIAEKEADTISWIAYGDDATGLRDKTREEMQAEGVPEQTINDERLKSFDWAYAPKETITDPQEKVWRTALDDAISAFQGSKVDKSQEQIAQEMESIGGPKWYWDLFIPNVEDKRAPAEGSVSTTHTDAQGIVHGGDGGSFDDTQSQYIDPESYVGTSITQDVQKAIKENDIQWPDGQK